MSTLREYIEDHVGATEEPRGHAVEWSTIPDPAYDAEVAAMTAREDAEFHATIASLLPSMVTAEIKKYNKRKKQRRARCK